jgi:hypothetical protein
VDVCLIIPHTGNSSDLPAALHLVLSMGTVPMSYFDAEGHIPVLAALGSSSSGGSRREGSTSQERLLALLDQIRAMDKTMDEARAAKIANPAWEHFLHWQKVLHYPFRSC